MREFLQIIEIKARKKDLFFMGDFLVSFSEDLGYYPYPMHWIVTEKTSLWEALQICAPDSSNTTRRSWIKEGRILVNGKISKDPRAFVDGGAIIELEKKRQYFFEGFEVLLQDRDILVVYKPAGLLSVATDTDEEENLHQHLKNHYKNRTVHVVHRLDREASGLMVFAFSEEALEGLQAQFEEHTVQREYMAIVQGVVLPSSGTWESYLVEEGGYVVRSTSDSTLGKRAVTHYQVVKQKGDTAALSIKLETGRKNQIRVHTSEAGFPILGDQKYRSSLDFGGRIALQARRLSFFHPIQGGKKVFTRELDPEFFSYC